MSLLAPSRPTPPPRRPASAPSVTLSGVSKRHGEAGPGVVALQDVDLEVAPGEFVCLVGASGCGKTTLLNLVAGLDRPTVGCRRRPGAGRHRCEERTPGRVPVAMLFQDSGLFPWLTVSANVELPLRLKGVAKAERRDIADDLLERVHLGGFGAKRPHELSGGMRQRAALARALAQRAGLLLMDEPFGALDAITRDLLHDELESLWGDGGFTVLFVTHNVREAARLGDRIVLLTSRPGRVAATWPVDLPRPRRMDSPEIATPGRPGHRPAAGRGGSPWLSDPARRSPCGGRSRRRRPRSGDHGLHRGPTHLDRRGDRAGLPRPHPGRAGRARGGGRRVAPVVAAPPVGGHLAQAGRPGPHPPGVADPGLGPLEAEHLPVAGHRGRGAVGPSSGPPLLAGRWARPPSRRPSATSWSW